MSFQPSPLPPFNEFDTRVRCNGLARPEEIGNCNDIISACMSNLLDAPHRLIVAPGENEFIAGSGEECASIAPAIIEMFGSPLLLRPLPDPAATPSSSSDAPLVGAALKSLTVFFSRDSTPRIFAELIARDGREIKCMTDLVGGSSRVADVHGFCMITGASFDSPLEFHSPLPLSERRQLRQALEEGIRNAFGLTIGATGAFVVGSSVLAPEGLPQQMRAIGTCGAGAAAPIGSLDQAIEIFDKNRCPQASLNISFNGASASLGWQEEIVESFAASTLPLNDPNEIDGVFRFGGVTFSLIDLSLARVPTLIATTERR